MTVRKPLIVGIGGTTRPGSSSECALQCALRTVEAGGGETRLLGGEFLSHLPIFNPANADQTDAQKLLADTVRQADGVIVASPGYHGSISGVIKNALDTLEVLPQRGHPPADLLSRRLSRTGRNRPVAAGAGRPYRRSGLGG